MKAARAIRAMGPRILVVKKGEHGVLMFTEGDSFAAPAYPLEEVFDPTGAGDTFAGGFVGYLAAQTSGAAEAGDRDLGVALRRAVIMGSTLASFCVEAFSVDRLLRLKRAEIDARYQLFKDLTPLRAALTFLPRCPRRRCVRIPPWVPQGRAPQSVAAARSPPTRAS